MVQPEKALDDLCHNDWASHELCGLEPSVLEPSVPEPAVLH